MITRSSDTAVNNANRLHGGLLVEESGPERSRLLAAHVSRYEQAGCSVWVGDPQGSAPSHLTNRAERVARSVQAIRQMFGQAQQIKEQRQAQNVTEGWRGWTSDQGRPGLVIVIDGGHRAFADPATRALASELAREGGKVGIAVVIGTSTATLEAFGGDAQLRDSLCAQNHALAGRP